MSFNLFFLKQDQIIEIISINTAMLDTISNINESHTIQDFYRNLKDKLSQYWLKCIICKSIGIITM